MMAAARRNMIVGYLKNMFPVLGVTLLKWVNSREPAANEVPCTAGIAVNVMVLYSVSSGEYCLPATGGSGGRRL